MNRDVPKIVRFGPIRSEWVIGTGVVLLAALLGFALKSLQSEYFPMRFVRIQGGVTYLGRPELETSLAPLLAAGYWDLDLKAIGKAVEGLPWVASVQTQRVWPDTLVLRIDEHVPFARFGEKSLISVRGHVFSPPRVNGFGGLPRIDGPMNKARELLAAFLAMQTDARTQDLKLKTLRVGERGNWSIETADALRIELGRDAPVTRFKRFIRTLALLDEQQIRSMVRVDLRYRNGYAVEWMPGSEPEWSTYLKRKDPRRSEAAQSI